MIEIAGAITAAKTALDLAANALKARDQVMLENALADARSKLMEVSLTAMSSIEKLASLQASLHAAQERNRQLEAEAQDRDRYQLAELGPTVYAYSLKLGKRGANEPNHHLCQHCFNKGAKSILQGVRTELGYHWSCHACKWGRSV